VGETLRDVGGSPRKLPSYRSINIKKSVTQSRKGAKKNQEKKMRGSRFLSNLAKRLFLLSFPLRLCDFAPLRYAFPNIDLAPKRKSAEAFFECFEQRDLADADASRGGFQLE
jgi:hypothetical protein